MKKRILLLLVAMIGMATSVGWAEDAQTSKLKVEDGKIKETNVKFVFANGNPVTIEGIAGNKVKVSLDETDFVELDESSNPVILGGSKDAEVASSNITMKSGTVFRLYGGGYGTSTSNKANVTGKTTLAIKGGTVLNSVFGGGRFYAHSKDVVINVSGAEAVLGKPGVNDNYWLICGGDENGQTSGGTYVDFDQSNNTVESAELTIDGGTFRFIALGGTDGAKGYIKNVTADIKNATITGGVFGNGSNGRSDEVVGTLTNCTFAPITSPIEVAAINRGIVKNISLTFNSCTFPESAADIHANLGATYRWGYNYNGSSAKVEGVPGKVAFVFDESCKNVPVVGVSDGLAAANATLTGAQATLAKFEWNKTQFHTEFTLDAGKTWTFNNGLEITNDVTFTNNGTLTVDGTCIVSNADQLNTAIPAIAEGGTINLAAGTYTLSNPLVVNKAITLQSATSTKAVIQGCVAVETEGATINNLAFEYAWTSSKYSDKTGIAVFGNSATITGNTFTTSSGEHGTNGIVFYPKTATAANYVVANNTFSLNQEGSTAIMVRENFKSTTQIPGVNATASLPNGSVVDASVTGGENVFTNVNGSYYCRLTGDYSVFDGTGSGDAAITHKCLYTYTNVDNLMDALTYSQAKSTINLSGTTSDAMLTKLNAGDKKALIPGICIKCSDATVYTDMASAQQSTATGTVKYIKLGDAFSLETPEALTVVPTIKTKPTASTIEAGQPLSASILTGGEATATVKEEEVVVSGVFSWKNPSTAAAVSTKSYEVVFTPNDLTKYEVVETTVEIKDIKQYYTVTIGKCDNGKIEVTDGNAAGKYVDGTKLVIKAIPNEHYDFSKWGDGITGAADNGSYTVNKEAVTANAVLTATFVAKKYAVTIGNNVKVTDQDGKIVSAGDLPYGTVLNVFAAPTENQGSLKALTCNDKEVINNTVTVDGALNIQATFNAFVPSTYRISLGENVKNGKIQLFDENGNAIAFGSALTKDTKVSVVAVPDPGYELDGSVTVVDATYANDKFTVGEKDVTVSATFKPKKYKVEIAAANATITLDKSGEQDYGTSITITKAEAAKDYKLLAVVVNGKEIAQGESFIVKGDTKVNAITQKLPDVVFTDVNQTYTYNKAAQAFVVRTVPAGISGIKISYVQEGSKAKTVEDGTPTEAGTYEVFATLDANSSYASMSSKKIGTLTIEKAPYPAAAIPTVSLIVTENDNENEYHWRSNADASKDFRTAYYKLPANSNYREPEFVIPTAEAISKGNVTAVKLGEGSWIKTRTTSTELSLNLSATGGSVSAWLGDAQVTGETVLYSGQTLTLKAIPANATYSTRPTWSENVKVDENGVASITLSDQAATVTAIFKDKVNAPFTENVCTSIYTGTAFGTHAAPTVKSAVSGWVVTFKQNGVTFDEPTAVGEYQMIASRPADDVYNAADGVTVGTLRITEAKAVISDVAGTDITTIQTLNQSVISGTANVEGTFSWVNPDAKLTEGEHADIAVLFTPADKNYAPVSGTAKVKVTALANDVAVRTIELKESDPANGNGVVLTLNGTAVTAGTTVKAGDKLTVTFSAKSGYTASAKINDTSYANGTEYVVKDEAGNVSIVVTYTRNSSVDPNPGTDPDPDVDVTGVSLDKSELTLAVKGTYTLKATVAPSDASNKNVTWKSSNDKIVTVDKDGKVTAVAIGKATITVATEDGNKTATCVVTVDAATGLEELIANTRVYGQDHTIRIEPAMPVNVLVVSMNGQLIYNDIVSSATQIPVPAAGIYIVKLGTGNDTSVRKVSVK